MLRHAGFDLLNRFDTYGDGSQSTLVLYETQFFGTCSRRQLTALTALTMLTDDDDNRHAAAAYILTLSMVAM